MKLFFFFRNNSSAHTYAEYSQWLFFSIHMSMSWYRKYYISLVFVHTLSVRHVFQCYFCSLVLSCVQINEHIGSHGEYEIFVRSTRHLVLGHLKLSNFGQV